VHLCYSVVQWFYVLSTSISDLWCGINIILISIHVCLGWYKVCIIVERCHLMVFGIWILFHVLRHVSWTRHHVMLGSPVQWNHHVLEESHLTGKKTYWILKISRKCYVSSHLRQLALIWGRCVRLCYGEKLAADSNRRVFGVLWSNVV
jgi:hypothetical protein